MTEILMGEKMLEAMRRYPAKIIPYREYDENAELVCPICGWRGSATDSGKVETDSHVALDVSCPECDKMLLVAAYSAD